MDLPPDLRQALTTELAAATPKALARTASDLSMRYRGVGGEAAAPAMYSDGDAAAYAAYRMPATYAAIRGALAALAAAAPDLRPASLLDVGAGPATAAWAAAEVWPDLHRATLVERDERMLALGQRLQWHAGSRAVREATWHRTDLARQDWQAATSDLVVAAYVLGEIPPTEAEHFVSRLWASATGAVVIVEPGTPRGFAVIRRARAALIAAGARIAAPCPHDEGCPMPEADWCHFMQRVARTALQRDLKGGTLSYEDEKFSYVAATRVAVAGRLPRVLRHPQMRKGLVMLQLCTPSGLQRRAITRRDGTLYKRARDVAWGSTLPLDGDGEGET